MSITHHTIPPRTSEAGPVTRRWPIGAEVQPSGLTHFRVWAPSTRALTVVLVFGGDKTKDELVACAPEPEGYFTALAHAPPGTRYWLQLDDGERYPNPASRFQPDGPHGPSEVIDPDTFAWGDATWPGVIESAPVVYELHVGTFTGEGTWASALDELPRLADLGVSVIEIMPLSEFPGRFGWGYDGVLPFAPTRLYGRPDGLRAFVNRAHELGLAVILDVVYNHFGPDGCVLTKFAPEYASPDGTEWGAGINFDAARSGPVREFFIANAGYWIEEFHFDGLRLDALQSIVDRSTPHVVAEVADEVRARGRGRRTWIVAEHEQQHAFWIRPGGDGRSTLDALWNDDFHHSARVALTGHREAYYTDYLGQPQEFISAAKRGFLYQGQWYSWQRQRRGTVTDHVPPSAFVCYLENHDQVANSDLGLRLHQLTSPGRLRAMTALLLLGPWTPMLFQGQEFASSAPFLYFADHEAELAAAVRKGRREFLAQFPSLAPAEVGARLPDPSNLETFLSSKIDQRERAAHAEALDLHRSLIALRRSDPAFNGASRVAVDGAVLGEHTFVLRFTRARDDAQESRVADRLLIVNLGGDTHLPFLAEPLLTPLPALRWRLVWSSNDQRFGGPGVHALSDEEWRIPAESALVLAPEIEV